MPDRAREVKKTSRYKGDHYIATPHTTHTTRRILRIEKPIAVTVKDGKYALEQSKDKPNNRVVEQMNESPLETKERQNSDIRITMHKQIFDELYQKYIDLKLHIRKQSILKDMLSLFSNEEQARSFVDEQWKRKRRNLYVR